MSDVTTELAKEASDKAMEIARLKAENAELREQGARLFDKTLELGTENDRLRELVDELYPLGATDARPTQVESSGTCTVEGFDDGIDEALDGSPIYTTPTWYLSCGHTCEGAERPSFCKNCGRKVVSE